MAPDRRCERNMPQADQIGGFTFLELLIVLAILGIMAMVVVPMIGPVLAEARLSRAAGEVASALEFAAYRALSVGRETRISVDLLGDTVRVDEMMMSSNILHGGASLPEAEVESGTFAAVADPMSRGMDYLVRVESVDISAVDFGSTTSVTFQTDGLPSTEGTIDLQVGDLLRQIVLDAATGKVTIQ